MSRSLPARVSFAVMAVALLLAGSTVTSCRNRAEPRPTPSPAENGDSLTPTAAPLPEETTMDVAVYLMNGEEIAHVTRSGVPKSDAVLKTALDELFKGTNSQEQAKGLATEVPEGTRLLGAKIENGIAKVDVTDQFDDGGGTLSMTARMAQLVYTATQFPSVKSVSLLIDGAPVDALGGEGIIIEKPQTRLDYENLTPAILVDGPGWFSTCASPFRVQGTANVFEATLQLEVYDGGNRKVFGRTITATSGTGTRGTWDVDVTWSSATPGAGYIRAFEYSAKDGSVIHEQRVPITVQ